MADTQIHPIGTESAPADFVIPPSAELLLKAVFASFNGTNAAGSFLPLLRVISDAGSTVVECVSATTVAAGASADVSWFPRVAGTAAAAPTPGGLTLLYDSGFLAAPAASIDTGVNGIAQTSTHLLIILQAQTTANVGEDHLGMRFNGDGAGNYDNHVLSILQSTTSVGGGQGANSCDVPIMPGTVDSGTFGVAYMFIPFYTGPTDKVVLGFSANPTHTQSRLADCQWRRGATAINQITARDYANLGNLTANSRMMVYGI